MITEEMLQEFKRRQERQNEITAELIVSGVPTVTAIVIAGDIFSAQEATERVNRGEQTAEEAVDFIGSYARFDWAVKNLPKEVLFKRLPDLWMSSDPDDTNPEYLKLWKEAYAANGNRIIQDEPEVIQPYLTQIDKPLFKIYRGQIGDQIGISWTLDGSIAAKFAATGGGRERVKGGRILNRLITSKEVLAYITGRGESEVIIDPGQIKDCEHRKAAVRSSLQK